MSQNFDVRYGIGAKGQPYGFETAKEIAQKHVEVLKTKSHVYFSTRLAVSDKVKNQIDTLLYYNQNEGILYLGHVETILTGDSDTFLPADAAQYSPEDYAATPAASWFLLSSFEPVDVEDLEGLITIKEGIPVLQKMSERGRFPASTSGKAVKEVMSVESDTCILMRSIP